MTTRIFSPNVDRLIELALVEDLAGGDVTTDSLFDGSERSSGRLVAKSELVLAGQALFARVFEKTAQLCGAPSQPTTVEFLVRDGELVQQGTTLARFEGPTVTLLRAERLGLNLLQRLSGIASTTRRFQQALGERVRITDTRKTQPGMRELERYAVAVGGGLNHRFNLGSGVLLKENHVRAAGGIAPAIERARRNAPHVLRIEVEVTSLDELQQALEARADIVMLDNMDSDTMRRAVELNQQHPNGPALLEASGNVTLERLPELAVLGIDLVSSGALTHSVIAADISMLFDV